MGTDTVFLIALFALWFALLFKTTTAIVVTQQSTESRILWVVLVWTVPLLGVILWTSLGRRNLS